MSNHLDHIHPVFDRLLQRDDREQMLGQRGAVFWFTGLSGSGKTTIAQSVERQLHNLGSIVQVLDGDNVRTGLCNNLSFSAEDREENIRRIAEVSKLFVESGMVVLACFVSPTISYREMAKKIIGENDFYEVFIDTPLDICESRDPKGLYKKARTGEIPNFTGISAPFEAPEQAALHLRTKNLSIDACAQKAIDFIVPLIRKKDA